MGNILYYAIVTGRPPFNGRNNKEILKKITQGKFYFPKNIALSKYCKDFIKKLVCLNCNKRLSPEQALKHPWLREQDNKANDINLGEAFLENINEFYTGNVLEKLVVQLHYIYFILNSMLPMHIQYDVMQ